MNERKILYVHGMGGGADSRIPRFLRECFASAGLPVVVICRTYPFDPSEAAACLEAWFNEIHPDMIIGESLGACHALLLAPVHRSDVNSTAVLPVVLVSPALNAPACIGRSACLALIPGFPQMLGRIFKPREGERQALDFHYSSMKPYRDLAARLRTASAPESVFAFFGKRDRYRMSGIVSLRAWKHRFGPGSFRTFDGTHYMEEEYIESMLVPHIVSVLGLK